MRLKSRTARITAGTAIPAVLALFIVLFLKFGSPPCLFHGVTGFFCPGCGAGRALDALFHLHPADALGYNALFTLSLPLFALFAVKYYVSFVSGRNIMPKLRITYRGAVIYSAVIGAFFILRNIPVEPFTLLKP